MEATRRGFFKLVAGAMAVPVAAKIAMAMPSVPMIYADGINDDAPGINALLRGDVVEFADARIGAGIGWRGDTLHFSGEPMTIKTTVFVPERPTHFTIDNIHIEEHREFDGHCLIQIESRMPLDDDEDVATINVARIIFHPENYKDRVAGTRESIPGIYIRRAFRADFSGYDLSNPPPIW